MSALSPTSSSHVAELWKRVGEGGDGEDEAAGP
jgi:hypothetical protein